MAHQAGEKVRLRARLLGPDGPEHEDEEGSEPRQDRPAQPPPEPAQQRLRSHARPAQVRRPEARQDRHGEAEQVDDPLLVPDPAEARRREIEEIVDEGVPAEGHQERHEPHRRPEPPLRPARGAAPAPAPPG